MSGSSQHDSLNSNEQIAKWVEKVKKVEERERAWKRKHLPNMPGSDSSNKRPRQTNDENPILGDQTPTSRSGFSLNQRTRLTPSIGSSQRSRSPNKELQLQIRQSIDIRGPESGQTSIPLPVRDLQRRLSKDFGVKVIPGGLREHFRRKNPHAFETTPTYAFNDDLRITDEELKMLWGTICGIHKNAADCQENKRDENAWSMLVVQQALLSGITTPGDDPSIIHDSETPALERGILELNSIQSQSIDARFLPALPNSDKLLSKKADFALVFNKAHPEVNSFYHNLSFGGQHLQLSQMTDTYTKRCAMFAGLEVKAPDGNEDEGVTQLAIWLAAGLNSIQELLECWSWS